MRGSQAWLDFASRFIHAHLAYQKLLTSVFFDCFTCASPGETESKSPSSSDCPSSQRSQPTARKALLIHICFQCLTTAKNLSAVRPRKKRPNAASVWESAVTASIDSCILVNAEFVEHCSTFRMQSNSGIKVNKANISKNKWNLLMCLAVEGAKARSEEMSSVYPLGLISTSNINSNARIAHTTLFRQMQSEKARNCQNGHISLGLWFASEICKIDLRSHNCNFVVPPGREKP